MVPHSISYVEQMVGEQVYSYTIIKGFAHCNYFTNRIFSFAFKCMYTTVNQAGLIKGVSRDMCEEAMIIQCFVYGNGR